MAQPSSHGSRSRRPRRAGRHLSLSELEDSASGDGRPPGQYAAAAPPHHVGQQFHHRDHLRARCREAAGRCRSDQHTIRRRRGRCRRSAECALRGRGCAVAEADADHRDDGSRSARRRSEQLKATGIEIMEFCPTSTTTTASSGESPPWQGDRQGRRSRHHDRQGPSDFDEVFAGGNAWAKPPANPRVLFST